MEGEKRRENILRILQDSDKPVSGTKLAEKFQISRQVVVQDIALLRAKKYNIIVLASVQLAEYMKGKLFLDASVLSTSKQIKEIMENLFLMRNLYTEELDQKNKFYCRPFRLKKVNDKWIEEDYELDVNGVYRALFVEKNRNGSNTSDTGVGYVLKYDGDHAIFREVAQARFKHGEIK